MASFLASRILSPLILSTLTSLACRADMEPSRWRMENLSGKWYCAGFENSLDLSGIAAANREHCLIGSDESFYVQPGVIDYGKQRIESRRPIALPIVSGDREKAEIDIEGVCYSPESQAYFVVGSHGVSKKKGDVDPERHAVHRLGVDSQSKEVKPGEIRRSSLLPWLQTTPQLAAHLNQPLQQNGLNIEGLTCVGETLYFGLRSPNKNGRAFVIELEASELFDGTPRELKVHGIDLGKARGIRELVAVKGGFVIVTGNASAEATKKFPETLAPGPDQQFDLLFWDGLNPTPEMIGTLPENPGKAEGLLVLDDADAHIDLLVLYDSLPGGMPVSVRLHR
ncbi:DUF6910 family protein [Haloferula chungangensis]|uniref:DUF6910 family protein n=1 Tax=Haloferula chungangensis TaxID=1048331 RepID=A0ABW2L6J9_9BACT